MGEYTKGHLARIHIPGVCLYDGEGSGNRGHEKAPHCKTMKRSWQGRRDSNPEIRFWRPAVCQLAYTPVGVPLGHAAEYSTDVGFGQIDDE